MKYKLVKRVLKKNNISFEDHPAGLYFYADGLFLHEELPAFCYEIAFKYQMRRTKVTNGFFNDQYLLEAISVSNEGKTLIRFFRFK